MALSMRTSAVRPTVRVQAAKPGVSAGLLAAVASATLLLGGVPQVQAGVVLAQPNVKRVLQGENNTPPRAKPAADGAAAAPAKRRTPEVSEQTGGVSAQTIALPGALAVIAGGTFAISKLDEGFFEFLEATSAKNSGRDGAGYEEFLKGGAMTAASGGRAGTKKVKAAKGGSSGGGGGGGGFPGLGGLGGFFGRK